MSYKSLSQVCGKTLATLKPEVFKACLDKFEALLKQLEKVRQSLELKGIDVQEEVDLAKELHTGRVTAREAAMMGSIAVHLKNDKKLKKALDREKKNAESDKPETWSKVNAYVKTLWDKAHLLQPITEDSDVLTSAGTAATA